MNIHEYQAKGLLKKYGVAVPRGGVAYTPQEAETVARELGGPVWVVKSQIHAGGRGAGRFKDNPEGKGGVRVVKSIEEVGKNAGEMLNHVLVTKQTGPEGREVKRLYVEEGADIKRELYLGMLTDRATGCVTIMASTEGGMEIEEVAHNTPEKIVKVAIDPATGIQGYHTRKVAFALGLEGKQVSAAAKFIVAAYQAFVDLDCAIVEINPLIVTGSGEILALDAKMSFDDNALFRHKDVEELRDEAEEDPAEIEAAKHSLNYVKLDGNIGCMVNGAGLAMATMDIIKLYGGEPANFLDVGGGATKERVTAAFKLILSDPNVEGILVNIFGGIMRCDVIAEGVVAAAREVHLHVPLVVRLEGTNVELGKKILSESGLPILSADNLADAADKVVKAVKEAA
ncbi:ADP-forming succinate--CoA ligase subunit beta [Azospirillum brasilense]|uniref:Succinate--CoA ligase [ADP-forming] subunit beta n=4 Tax=Alphaproteobacteria TaxID=28211 RepID=A0A0P0EA78_AZOBR|nr:MULTISPECIES: ADP-forming succinate--CoA ligase subunit beta [Azospirillum]ALJ34398.1 succinyl-CoA synthetase subunit beta [Azospirillum brasilense]MDW7557521.1 ADP-forming succinate--CoA ligase subunit beta [Azospirillum brasilense]MDW7597199.1 ADP-forming succinate--CoA ligase subunit beta [Azospirillum brasilense]MDW7632374.1 ADP-forming succinate--CoA ligase subunit beta [Azospirillum brasilense]MDX5953010.1 ADP-forming succinate--CoA ligase subunit beta [Azospirillum brasilense]